MSALARQRFLNALLQDKFSEVSMKRTTAGVNYFRIFSTQKPSKKRKRTSGVVTPDSCNSSATDVSESKGCLVTAAEALAEITQDNQVLRQSQDNSRKDI